MARITNTTDIGSGLTQTEENRTRRVCIEVSENGTVGITFEREGVTRINGRMIGGPAPADPARLTDAQARAVPLFATCFGALAAAGDAAEQAEVDARAAEATAQAASEVAAP